MNRYDKYKDSGIEWIGEIPSHWKEVKIKYLAIGENTLFLDGDWIESKEIVFDDDNIRYITTGNVGEGKYKEQGDGYITEEAFEKLHCTEVYPGDLLISRLNHPIGRACLVPDLGKRIVTSVDNVIVRPNHNYSKEFLVNFFSNSKYFEYTMLEGRGTTMQRISRSILGNIKIVIPNTLEEQTAIATYLDRKTSEIDELIADKKRLVELYEEEKAAIINQAVTKGINPNVKMKDSGVEWLGKIPEHWEVKRLKYVLCHKLMYGANEATNEACRNNPRYIRITDFDKSGKLRDDTFQSLSPEIANDYLLAEGDILFARSGATVGKTFQFKNYEGKACFAGYLIKATPIPDVIDSDFLYYYTKSGAYENWKESVFNQATIQNIGADKYAMLWVPMPLDIQAQQSIVQHIETECADIDTKISKTNKLIKLLTEYRIALINEVVTGKIKVTD